MSKGVGYEYDYLYKVLIIGDSGAGKSCLLVKYTDDVYTENYISTIGVDFRIKTVSINNKKVKLQLWDTAGQERFRNLTNSYYRNAHFVSIIFDITRLETFENIYKWMDEVIKYARPDVHILLVGTKSDLSEIREVSHDMINNITKQLNVKYVETSAKTGSNVDCVFNMICQHLLTTSVPHEKSKVSDLILLTKDEPIAKPGKSCCWN